MNRPEHPGVLGYSLDTTHLEATTSPRLHGVATPLNRSLSNVAPSPVLRGRSAAISEALAELRRTRRTGQGRVVVIGGEAGIGKSAVLAALRREARAAGCRATWVKARTADRLSPGSALLLALSCGREPLLSGSQLAAVSSLVDEPTVFIDHVAKLLDEAVGESPALIAIDDLQWVDHLSRMAAYALPERLSGSPIVWIYTTRDSAHDVAERLHDGHSPVHVLDLGPLSRSALVELGRDLLGEEPDAFVLDLLGRVGGNPFYAVQMLKAVAHARERGEAFPHVPPEFIRALRRRLAPLSDVELLLVRLIATLGRPATFGELTRLLDTSEAPLSAAIETLLGVGLLEYEGHALTFRHDLVRESVYEELSSGIRRELHQRCADFLLAEGAGPLSAAAHIRVAASNGDEDAAELLMQAAEEARGSMPDTAAELALAAFELLRPDSRARHGQGLRALRVLAAAQQGSAVITVADAMLAHATSPESMAAIEIEASQALRQAGRTADLVERVRARLADDISEGARARLMANWALVATGYEGGDAVLARAQEALELARRAQDRAAVETAEYALAELAMKRGSHAEALRRTRRLQAAAGDARPSAEVLSLQLLDRFPEAQEEISAAARTQTCTLPSVAYARMWQDFGLGRGEDARAGARTVVGMTEQFGDAEYGLAAHLILSLLAQAAGDIDEARAELAAGVRLNKHNDPVWAQAADVVDAALLAATGDLDAALALLRPRLAEALDRGAYWPWQPGLMVMVAHMGLAAGDRTVLTEAARIAEEGSRRNPDVASFEGVAYHVRGLAADDIDLLRTADSVLARSPRPVLQAFVASDLGRSLLDKGLRSEAVTQVERAWKIYDEIGYTVAAEDSRRLLSSVGVRRAEWSARSARPASGWDALTRTEVTVAKLIGGGLTNRAVAVEMGISPNTVGTHMRSIFNKLGIHSRVQLANALRDHSPGVLPAK
ncbi:AAA family ATPase [Streptomyces sp. NPDC001215]